MSAYWQDVKAIAREIWEMFQDPEHTFAESSGESREGEAWMAASNSKWITEKKRWQDVLGISRNVPDPDDLSIDLHRKRVYWEPHYPEYPHWWEFVPGEDPELTLKRLGAAAAMKRDIDDAIEEYDKMRRKRWGVQGVEEDAWAILEEAEQKIGAWCMAEDRASCGEWPMPKTPEDFLAWIEDEAELQEEQADAGHDAQRRLRYAKKLRSYANRLRALGLKPTPMPWFKKRKRWGLSDAEADSVLQEARDAGLYSVLDQIADYYQVPVPETPEEILGWLIYARDEDMRAMAGGWSDYERAEAEGRLLLIGKFIRKLKMLEVIPVSPPWVRERRRWGVEGIGMIEDEVQAILDEAERDIELVSAIEQDVANNGEPPPESPGEWLTYIYRQIRYDQTAAEQFTDPDDRARYKHYVQRARVYANRIEALGVRPVPFAWAKERLRWKPKLSGDAEPKKPRQVFTFMTKRWDIDKAQDHLRRKPRVPVAIPLKEAFKLLGMIHVDTAFASKIGLDTAEPLILAPVKTPQGKYYMIIDGWHRVERARQLGVESLPGYLLTDREAKAVEV